MFRIELKKGINPYITFRLIDHNYEQYIIDDGDYVIIALSNLDTHKIPKTIWNETIISVIFEVESVKQDTISFTD